MGPFKCGNHWYNWFATIWRKICLLLLLLGRIACTQCIRYGLLLQMSHVTWSVCLSVSVTRMYCAKTAEPIEMPFGEMTFAGPKNHVLDGGQLRSDDRTNPIAAARIEWQVGDAAFCQITVDICCCCCCCYK